MESVRVASASELSDIVSMSEIVGMAATLAHAWRRPTQEEVVFWRRMGSYSPEDLLRGSNISNGHLTGSKITCQGLLQEYDRLFEGPGAVQCCPYESYWRLDVPVEIRHTIMGPCVADLDLLYQKLNLGLSSDQRELADHIAVEFEALMYALASGTDESRDVARVLVLEHLVRWVPLLCRSVRHETTSPFYDALSSRTVSTIPLFAKYINNLDHVQMV